MLHTLPGRVQLISRKVRATIEDYHQHFFSLYETANTKINSLIEDYVKDLSTVIDINEFQVMKYYAVFSTPLHSNSDLAFAQAAQRLTDMGICFSSSLALEKIYITHLPHKQLIAYFKEQFRNKI